MPPPAKTDSTTPGNGPLRGVGRLTVWAAGSALLGSVALVLWNRRTLKKLREAANEPIEPIRVRDDDGIY